MGYIHLLKKALASSLVELCKFSFLTQLRCKGAHRKEGTTAICQKVICDVKGNVRFQLRDTHLVGRNAQILNIRLIVIQRQEDFGYQHILISSRVCVHFASFCVCFLTNQCLYINTASQLLPFSKNAIIYRKKMIHHPCISEAFAFVCFMKNFIYIWCHVSIL